MAVCSSCHRSRAHRYRMQGWCFATPPRSSQELDQRWSIRTPAPAPPATRRSTRQGERPAACGRENATSCNPPCCATPRSGETDARSALARALPNHVSDCQHSGASCKKLGRRNNDSRGLRPLCVTRGAMSASSPAPSGIRSPDEARHPAASASLPPERRVDPAERSAIVGTNWPITARGDERPRTAATRRDVGQPIASGRTAATGAVTAGPACLTKRPPFALLDEPDLVSRPR